MATKKELLAQEVSRAVGAGKAVTLQTVDFNDPKRPKTCLEVDFPLVPINEIAGLEASSGALKKPIYQMSKWWARRQSSVFRSLLISAATKAPDDPSQAAKLVWDSYYSNHGRGGAFTNLSVADIFMGGGTTLVEGSRLGFHMVGNDLNPIAWFIVKQELAKVSSEEITRLLSAIEEEVRAQLMPFYACSGPGGEKGRWIYKPTSKAMDAKFDPTAVPYAERKNYAYVGPEVIYTFWDKHGPCQVTGCGHCTPIMTSPLIAAKTLSVKYRQHSCSKCDTVFDVEESETRLAPDVALIVADDERPFAILDGKGRAACPECGVVDQIKLGPTDSKKIQLSVFVAPEWLAGTSRLGDDNKPLGGSAQDDGESTVRWNTTRTKKIGLIEVRGQVPEGITSPTTGKSFATGKAGGTVPKKSHYACGACGTVQDVLETVKASGKTGPIAAYAYQGYSASAAKNGAPNGGRFFAPMDGKHVSRLNAATIEWEARKVSDLKDYWPKSAIPIGAEIGPHDVEGHNYTHWSTLFNPRQLLTNALLLKAICTVGGAQFTWEAREYVLGAFQQFIRCNTLLSIWHLKNGQISAALSNSNFHPRSTSLEPSPFSPVGDGSWKSAVGGLTDSLSWKECPWELVTKGLMSRSAPKIADRFLGKTEKIKIGDGLDGPCEITCSSSTDLKEIVAESIDLVVTDPPFGGLVQYSELADFFYVWLRLALKDRYPQIFLNEYTPKAMEAVSNRARQPDDPDGFYQRILTECWREANRILKPGGILAFTFHHSEDEPWVAVLESLFDAGFYLEATYPIRSDETKGDGEFGSKTIEYDIVHVCRKRTENSTAVSWARMRREVLQDVRQLEAILGNHARAGLPAADIQVIRRGKALEYFSRHYGKVLVEEGRSLSVAQALVGINQLIEEETDVAADLPPVNAEPLTRQFLRIFRGKTEVDRDQLQKFLRGTGVSPEVFQENGWSVEQAKRFKLVPSTEFALQWKGRQRKGLTHDYDQAWFLIGACHDGTGINASEQLRNDNFKPHPALKPLLDWFSRNGIDANTRQAAIRASTIYNAWADSNQEVVAKQMEMFA